MHCQLNNLSFLVMAMDPKPRSSPLALPHSLHRLVALNGRETS
jgi:hypothetical protein